MLIEFRPLRTVLLLSLIMAFVSWNCYATVTDVSQMLWLSRRSDNGSSSSSWDRKSSGLSRRHLLNPDYRTTAVGCRHIHCLFRQPQVKAQLEDSALHSAKKSVVQPVLPRSITSSIRMARRKTWPEGVAERRGRKAWLKSVAEKRGRKAWSEGVAERRGRKTCLPESQDFFKWQNFSWDLHASRRCPTVSDDGVHLQGKVVLHGEQRPSRPKGGLRFVTAVSNNMSVIERDSALRL